MRWGLQTAHGPASLNSNMANSPSTRSRILLSILMVLVQVVMLPGQGRIRCMLKTKSDSCCCTIITIGVDRGTERSDGAVSCCHGDHGGLDREGETAVDDWDSGRSARCLCGLDAKRPNYAPGFDRDGNDRSDAEAPAALVAETCSFLAQERQGKSEVGYVVPRLRTGPPLHVLFEVFLI